MKPQIKIVIAESSEIIRKGVAAVLKHIYHNVDFFYANELEQLKLALNRHKPDILFINPILVGSFGFNAFKKNILSANTKTVALQTVFLEQSILKDYDRAISIYDSEDFIGKKILSLINEPPEKDKPQNVLSMREKDVILGVIKGLTNKQIADKLCLSVHTIITHRRNIASKLQIHSAAGLTIYAISNKLVEVDD
ncbi:MAG: LuxR C-terminal-related transcriptional regulator [Prevotellaceae bacterium]|jgi:DNA-binding NarL/FixJ family response regulator|nr:LuxR C-terminal-related transcriptional regulator [Prevotellaceae bacterium]